MCNMRIELVKKWTIVEKKHKSHLIALFIHRKRSPKVIIEFFSCFFMPLYVLKLISAVSLTALCALNNRYQRNISSPTVGLFSI
jgi:hypothetical protein